MDFIFNDKIKQVRLSSLGILGLDELARKDGRFLGNAMETILEDKFDNLIKRDDNAFYDMDTPDNRLVEVRVVGKYRYASFDSSSNVGKGRSGKHLSDTLSKMDKVTDWIFVDILNFPNVEMYHISRDKALALFEGSEAAHRRINFNKFKEVVYG